MARYIAALSGGVDSAVAAALATQEGHDVTAVHFAFSKTRQASTGRERGCCTVDDAHDARRAADAIGIPFFTWDLSDTFHENVISDFLNEYSQGRTPNPCLRCNELIKFKEALNKTLALGFDGIITGHYAKVNQAENGQWELRRSSNPSKEQSYVVSTIHYDDLPYCLFPLGDFHDKEDVRAEAQRLGIRVAQKRDSTDICFIPDGETSKWIEDRLGARPGPIVDASSGETVGEHRGTHLHTIGQRRGLNLSSQDGQRRYVTSVDTPTNTVFVGMRDLLSTTQILVSNANWLVPEPRLDPWTGHLQIRAHSAPLPATVTPTPEGDLTVDLHSPEFGVAPGQQAVMYDGDKVVVSGRIAQ